MATTRPQIPVTNLKERIAALEQRNAGTNGASRPTSPTPSTLPVNSTTAPGFRDKIAKFERKGGVPVPRGSFGLGAPPPASDGPRKRGELYGNRIPAPARAVSGSVLSTSAASRASSPTPSDTTGAGLSPTSSFQGDRRSFSLSSVMSEFDDSNEYTPVSSPTLTFPSDSPDLQAHTPESSPSLSLLGNIPGSNKHIVRGTSFQKAMEIARIAETSKLENKDFIASISQQAVDSTASELVSETGPAVTVLSEEPTPVGIHHSHTAEHSEVVPSVVEPEPSTSEVQVTNEAPVVKPTQEVPIPEFPLTNVTPLEIRKRRPTDATPPKVIETAAEEIPPIPSEAAPIVVIHAPPAEHTAISTSSIPDQSTSNPAIVLHESDAAAKSSDAIPITEAQEFPVTIGQPEFGQTEFQSLSDVSAPETTVEAATTPTERASRNPELTLTLNSENLDDDSAASPLDVGNTSAVSLTEMLGAYFTGKDVNGDTTFRPATPPSQPVASPMSPYATLAYDVPETPEKERVGKPIAIDVPELQSFLSPPPTTGHRFSAPSSGGSSLGSSSLGSRPMSMIEPASVARAMRMTPATGRGVPMFLPPTSAAPRKSDFAHFPPTPVEEESAESAAVSQSSMTTQSPSLPGNGGDSSTLTSVVHGKVSEVPAPRRLPQTPQMKRVKHMTSVEPPPSPGFNELAMLLQEAMLLEDSLDRGELPTEARVRMDAEEKQRKEEAVVIAAAQAEARKVQEEDERRRLAAASERLRAKRDEPTSGRLKHTFLVPLVKSRSVNRKEVSAPEPETTSHDVRPPKYAGVTEKSAVPSTTQSHFSQSSQLHRPKTPETGNSSQHLETLPKSSKTSRFPSFRRLGSMTAAARPNTIHGHSTRNSVSTSSDDSAAVVTPPEGTLEFASSRQSNVSEFGGLMTNGSTTSFPSLSPKKSASSLGRAASFAERVFSRTRTKSSGSNLSTASEITDRIPEDVPSLPTIHIGPLPSTSLAPIPDAPAIVLPVSDTETKIFHPPKRSTSLARSSRLPPIPIEFIPPLPAITPTAFFATAADASDVSGDSFLIPVTADTARPTSWASMSSVGSLGSLPSPLFDKDLFDSFPSVPMTMPSVSATASLYPLPRRSVEQNNTVAYERPSFDSDLLSSAIHLASTRKSTAPTVPAPATNTFTTSTSRPTTPVTRRSVETLR